MIVRCCLKCTSKKLSPLTLSDGSVVEGAHLEFNAIYECDPSKRVAQVDVFGPFTPSAQFRLFIANPAAHAQYEEGKFYYFDSVPVPE